MSPIKKLLLATATLALSLGMTTTALADTTNFDFESSPSTPAASGSLTSLAITQDGLTMTLSRVGGSTFDIRNPGSGTPASWGSRILDPFSTTVNTAFNANFSLALSSISIDMGDFVPSDLDTLSMVAFDSLDGTGNIIGSTSAVCCATGTNFVFTTLTVNGAGIRSVRFIGGSASFPNSVFADNITVTFNQTEPVPEPATMLLLGTGLAGIAAKIRRRRNAKL